MGGKDEQAAAVAYSSIEMITRIELETGPVPGHGVSRMLHTPREHAHLPRP